MPSSPTMQPPLIIILSHRNSSSSLNTTPFTLTFVFHSTHNLALLLFPYSFSLTLKKALLAFLFLFIQSLAETQSNPVIFFPSPLTPHQHTSTHSSGMCESVPPVCVRVGMHTRVHSDHRCCSLACQEAAMNQSLCHKDSCTLCSLWCSADMHRGCDLTCSQRGTADLEPQTRRSLSLRWSRREYHTAV